jgi:small subunit ribosomal protein S35
MTLGTDYRGEFFRTPSTLGVRFEGNVRHLIHILRFSMATVVKRLVLSSRRHPRHISSRYTPKSVIPWQRPFSSTISHFEERSYARAEWDELLRDLRSMDSKALQKALNSSGEDLSIDMGLEDEDALDIEQEERGKIGFFGEGEEELGPDDDYYGDDITALGHGELEQHRELREYARLAAWELPLLSSTYCRVWDGLEFHC